MNSTLKKNLEIFLVVAVLLVSGYLLFPSLYKIFNFSVKSTSESNTESAIKYTRELYTTLNMSEGVVLPFKLEFDRDKYTIYSQGIVYNQKGTKLVDSKRELPRTGYIEIKEDGSLDAQNLTYGIGGYICSQTTEIRPVCVK